MSIYTLEEIARTSDEAAVRGRFDARNLTWLKILAWIFAVMNFGVAIGMFASANVIAALGAVAGLAGAIFVIYGSRGIVRSSKLRLVLRHISATVIGFVTLQAVSILCFNIFSGHGAEVRVTLGSGSIAWSILLPLLMLGFRMAPVELILLHSSIFVVTSPLASTDREAPLVAAFVINLFALAHELYASHRLRKQVTREFSERRSEVREQLRMRDELHYARELQLSMLPEAAPDLEWIDLAGASQPATEVGGDYFDYFVDGDSVAVVCADVAGHGMASFVFLSALRSGLMLMRSALTDPAGVLLRLRDLVEQTSRRRTLVTVAIALFDRSAAALTVANAGHPPLIRRRGDETEMMELFAPPLGARLPSSIPQRKIGIEQGDIFVMHSDGIYECRNAAGDSFGLERLAAIVEHTATTTAVELRDEILGHVQQFLGGALQSDDVTVVVARVRQL
jgi:serine phosphatase RsbU (regulator of sigma subunit)